MACMMPKTTAASELWADVCLCSDMDEGVVDEGIPAGRIVGDVSLLTDSFLPSTKYVNMMPFPFTFISPRGTHV